MINYLSSVNFMCLLQQLQQFIKEWGSQMRYVIFRGVFLLLLSQAILSGSAELSGIARHGCARLPLNNIHPPD